MKLSLLLMLGTMGCYQPAPEPAPVTFVPGYTTVTGLDFTRYSSRGFLFTTEMYPGSYDAMGLITVTRVAAATLDSTPDTLAFGGVVWKTWWHYETLHVEAVLDTMFARATAMKADAVVKLTITPIERIGAPGIEVSGFAIHRTDKH